ncbi:hypothetical protein M2137_002328 [Parabacteroides sp. PFB2-10]|uniref:hypothetical protein n=1 Tax=Parabacteroides sp. PFB2-10 TaxID=1742405 RepID=UPI0024749C6A|nr:hypothetical protein [Parabacteroides sp. PFB2-10]MDH6313538.1 hypothetical protein [Parabacteroides sp. PFB2-10]
MMAYLRHVGLNWFIYTDIKATAYKEGADPKVADTCEYQIWEDQQQMLNNYYQLIIEKTNKSLDNSFFLIRLL